LVQQRHLLVEYTGDAQGALPQRLFLKMVDANQGEGEFFDESEVNYYPGITWMFPVLPLCDVIMRSIQKHTTAITSC
jgi:hypothetical protein